MTLDVSRSELVALLFAVDRTVENAAASKDPPHADALARVAVLRAKLVAAIDADAAQAAA